MRLFLVISCLVLLGCNQEKKALLQSNVISLSQPKITANSTLIDSFVSIKADLKLDNVSIHYTSDGKEPNELSTAYSQPIITDKAGTYKFKAFHPGWNPSEVSLLTLYSKGIAVDTIVTHIPASKQYSGLGNNTLINYEKGTLNFRDKQWVGYDTIAKASVVLKEKKNIKSLTICYLTDVTSWIFPPSHISVVIDKNEASKKEVAIEIPKAFTLNKMGAVVIPIDKEIRSLTIEVSNLQAIPEWHEGAGSKAWLFMDEWILNEL